MKKKRSTLSLVGAGRVGSTLTSALRDNGFSVASVISRNGRDAVSLSRSVDCPRASTQIADIDRGSDLYIIAVDDGELGEVVRAWCRLPRLNLKGRTVLHTSGVHPASLLAPLKKFGASVAAFHPLQTFPRGVSPSRLRTKLKGIYYGIDGDDEAVRTAESVAALIGGRPLRLSPETRPLYHVACVFASGYLSVMLNAIAELSRTSGISPPWTEVFGPLMTTAMENTVRSSAGETLTGPVLRGDLETLRIHQNALEEFAPQYLPLYTVSALEVARLALNTGRIDRGAFDAILGLFRAGLRTGKKQGKKQEKKRKTR